jgi:hypothetical protein
VCSVRFMSACAGLLDDGAPFGFLAGDIGIDLLGVIPATSAVFACSRLPSSDAPSNQRA